MNSQFIQIKNTNYHFLEYINPGKEKLVLLHGLATDSHYWEKLIDFLRSCYLIIKSNKVVFIKK